MYFNLTNNYLSFCKDLKIKLVACASLFKVAICNT